ncbi:MAG: helix-turn-helix domain-containing protein [Clostridium butyricum]|nr:helix-turn-helix domain-containing protein [Clostridium butyricum]MDI9210519.1 hypothetical protein [Clostridium butyricum]
MIETRHTDEERQECVNEYLNGKDKDYLSGKYAISVRTIDRWIKELNVDEVKLKIAKRCNTVPIDVQSEILKVLNTNPILKGFNISRWNEVMLMKYVKDKYCININRRMAKSLIEDASKCESINYEEKINADIDELYNLGYSLILLDYIKIGRISSRDVEALQIREYTESKLDVNLAIARAQDYIYLDVIMSEQSIVDKTRITITKKSDGKKARKKLERREIIKDKYKLLMKVYESEKYNDIVVMTKYDKDIEALIRKKGDIKYFIINDEMYDTLSQTGYEGECCKTIVKYLEDENNENRAYKGAGDISKVIRGKIERCVLNVITDKIDSENSIEI